MQHNFEKERRTMVEAHIVARGVKDRRVLDALYKIPRQLFVPEEVREYAYSDEPLPIGERQTISQPYIVAFMSEALQLKGEERVLEIGTGSGYQTAVLAELVHDVFSIEILDFLSSRAKKLLNELGYRNIHLKVGDGNLGWKEHAPFDGIMVTAASPKLPEGLIAQLRQRGRMIVPVGRTFQELILVTRKGGKISKKTLLPVRFVPLVTRAPLKRN